MRWIFDFDNHIRYNFTMSSQSIISLLEVWMKKYRLPLMPVIWGVTCVIVGGLVAIGLYSYYSAEKAMAEQFNRQQLVLAEQAARGMENFLADLGQTTALLTRLPEVQDLKGGDGRGDRSENLRALYQNYGGGVDFLFWVDHEGRLNSSYPQGRLGGMLGKKFDFQPYFQKVRLAGRPVLTHVGPPSAEEPSQGQPPPFGCILFASPVFLGGEFVGILGGGLDFKKFYERFVHPMHLSSP